MVTKTRRLQLQAPLPAGNLLTLTGGGVSKRIQLLRTEVDPFPPDTETMIYHAENLDPNVEYTDFTITSSNRAKIGYTDDTTDLYIPAAFLDAEDGVWYKATKIGDSAFKECINIISIYIPDTVVKIGHGTLATMGGSFYKCTSLERVHIPDGVTAITMYSFYGCTSLKSITIPDSVTSMGNYAFSDCTNLTDVTIGKGLISISHFAFDGCTSLESVTIPNSVTTLWNCAFKGCTSLTSIDIPESVTDIETGVFSECTALSSVTLHSSLLKIGMLSFANCNSLESIVIPDSVTRISYDAFENCNALARMVFEKPTGWYKTTSLADPTSGTVIDLSDPTVAISFMTAEDNNYNLVRVGE